MNNDRLIAPASSLETKAILPDAISLALMKAIDRQLDIEINKARSVYISKIINVKNG